MKITSFEAVVFDLDGTLIDAPVDWLGAKKEIADFFQKQKIALGDQNLNLAIQLALEKMPKAKRASAKKQTDRILAQWEMRVIGEVEATAGAQKLLNWLGEKNIPMALVTRNTRPFVEAVWQKLAFHKMVFVTREDFWQTKPHSEALELALKKLQKKPSQSAIVGDTWHDMEMAKALGLYRILRRNPKLKTISEDLADLAVDSLEELMIDF